jgi:hypothetical protein
MEKMFANILHLMGLTSSPLMKQEIKLNKLRKELLLTSLNPFFTQLGLTSNNVLKLHETYNEMDAENDGNVDMIEFTKHYQIEETKFLHAIFFSSSANYITFAKFVTMAYFYSLADKKELGKG